MGQVIQQPASQDDLVWYHLRKLKNKMANDRIPAVVKGAIQAQFKEIGDVDELNTILTQIC